MKPKITADKFLSFVIALVLLTIAIVLIAAASHFRQVNTSAKMIAHTQDVIIQSEKMLSLIIDNQVLSRGYAITGSKELANALAKSRAGLYQQFDSLKLLTRDNEKQQARVDSLLWYIDRRVTYSDSIIWVHTERGRDEAIKLVSQGQGKFYVDKAKEFISGIQKAENILLVQRRELNERKTSELNGILLSVMIFMMLLLGLFMLKVRADFKAGKRTADTLATLNAHLEEKVTERTKELYASKKMLEETFLRIRDAFVAFDRNWCYTFINKRAAAMIGRNAEDLIGKNVWHIFPDAVDSPTYRVFQQALEEQRFIVHEDYYAPLDLWHESHIYPSPEGISVYINDISEKKKAAEKIRKANRLYFFISQVNQMIVRTPDEKTLFEEACRIAVEQGMFRMAWIGITDEKSKTVVPVMFAGEERGYLTAIKKIIAADVPEGTGPTAQAIRQGNHVICNDIETDPVMKPWKEAALERGYYSCMVLPIKKFGEVIGAFSFFAGEKHFFDDAEIALLSEATGDVSFALENIEKEKIRQQVEAEVKKSNDRFELIAHATNDVVWDWNLHTNEIWWNNNFYSLFGHDKQKLFADINSWTDGIHPDDRTRVTAGVQRILDSGNNFWHDEYRHLKNDGSIVFVYDRGFVMHDEAGKPYRMIGSMLDITELKNAEEQITREKNLSDSIINSLPGIFYLYNEEGRFLRWNSNFETVSGYSADEISRMHPLDFFDESEKDLLRNKITNVFVAGEDSVQAGFLLQSKEKLPYYFTGKAIEYQGQKCLMGVGIDFSERIKAQEEIRQSNEKLQELMAHLQEIREVERKRIGREIHDELGQQLTAIKMDVTWLNKKISESFPELKEKLKNIVTLLNGSNQSIRRILSELRPTILDDYGLVDALEWLSSQFTDTTGIPVEFTADETSVKIGEQITTCIFRIYQEALTNITRYANAGKVVARLRVADQNISFVVEDDGKGFDPAATGEKKSFGILGMKERVLSLKGDFSLHSAPGKGTRIDISIPL